MEVKLALRCTAHRFIFNHLMIVTLWWSPSARWATSPVSLSLWNVAARMIAFRVSLLSKEVNDSFSAACRGMQRSVAEGSKSFKCCCLYSRSEFPKLKFPAVAIIISCCLNPIMWCRGSLNFRCFWVFLIVRLGQNREEELEGTGINWPEWFSFHWISLFFGYFFLYSVWHQCFIFSFHAKFEMSQIIKSLPCSTISLLTCAQALK